MLLPGSRMNGALFDIGERQGHECATSLPDIHLLCLQAGHPSEFESRYSGWALMGDDVSRLPARDPWEKSA